MFEDGSGRSKKGMVQNFTDELLYLGGGCIVFRYTWYIVVINATDTMESAI